MLLLCRQLLLHQGLLVARITRENEMLEWCWGPLALHPLTPGPLTVLSHLLSCPDHLVLIRINWLSKMCWINGLMRVDLNPKFGKGGMFPCHGAGSPCLPSRVRRPVTDMHPGHLSGLHFISLIWADSTKLLRALRWQLITGISLVHW